MDKETLVRLAQPAATALLALAIVSAPLVVKAQLAGGNGGSSMFPIYVQCVGGCR